MRRGCPTEVAIIGAGPYGLALAAHLRARNIPFRIFGHPMESWLKRMPEGMYLKSEGFASNIADPSGRYTLAAFCRRMGRRYGSVGVPISIETFTDYGLWFQQTLVPEVEPTEVRGVRAEASLYEMVLATGEVMHTPRVVVAAGHVPHAYIPPGLRDVVAADGLSHSADHRHFRNLERKKIAVVGGGQSALETAALLREQGAYPVVLVRKESIAWNGRPPTNDPGARNTRPRTPSDLIPRPVAPLGAGWRLWFYSELPMVVSAFPEATRLRLLGVVLGPAGAWWLRDRVEGKVELLLGHSVVGATPDNGKLRLKLAGGGGGQSDLVVEKVIAATGYRVSLDRLTFLEPQLRTHLGCVQGAPILSSCFESSAPGLYFVGLAAAATFGPVMRFVCGAGFAARRVTAHVARRQRPRAQLRARRPATVR